MIVNAGEPQGQPLDTAASVARPASTFKPLKVVDRVHSDDRPMIHEAYFTRPTGLEMIGQAGISQTGSELVGKGGLSQDGGRTWMPFTPTPDFTAGIPHGYRREPFPAVCDPHTGRIVLVYNALDTPGLDPALVEPPISYASYYLRYRVSIDAGRTWLFDEMVIQDGHTEANPFDGVWKGKNGIFFGDVGCVPIVTAKGDILAPVQICPLGSDGKLANPGGGANYHEVAVLIGTWTKDNRLKWNTSRRVIGDPQRTTRGVFEPTLAELPDGRILMVMRGSNERKRSRKALPGYKWVSVSDDSARTWSDPKPWMYSDGEPFFSPSSMSLLFVHSSRRIFWIGNITPANGRGNNPRWPLVIGEVDPQTLGLVKSSIVELDTRRDDDPQQVDISHCRAVEDRTTKEIVLTAPRALNQYQSATWTLYRLEVDNQQSAQSSK
ncbi:MAG: exo-alpha-sialidase [Planctomycetia bacterium]|nr:exo-alpha-sialidase [Planctomycetia bacterium]